MLLFLEEILFDFSRIFILILELLGALVIVSAAVRIFYHYIFLKYTLSSTPIRMKLTRGLALGLEFYLGAEILKTIFIRDVSELYIVGAIIVLRAFLSLVINREMEQELRLLEQEEHEGD